MKGRDPTTGIEVEVFSASAQVGKEIELQAGMARVGVSGTHGSATMDVFTARVQGGIHNDDGSVGINVGYGTVILGAEGTYQSGANSLTLGISAGTGAAASIGTRDQDGDGNRELCAKASVQLLTVGFCVERPEFLRALATGR